MWRPAERAHPATPRSPTSPAPGRAMAQHPDLAHLELTDERMGRVPRRRRGPRAALLRAGRPARRPGARRRAARQRRDRDGVRIRGIIDRLELDDDGELVVTDYKTGGAPGEGWEQKSMAGVHIYSLMCERMFGRRPKRVQLLYLSKPERIVTAVDRPDDARRRGEDQRGDARGAQRVHPRRLPAPRVEAVRVLLVPRVLSRVRRRSHARGAGDARRARPIAKAVRSCRSRGLSRAASVPRLLDESPRSTRRSTAPSTASAPPRSTVIVYGLSSAADHSLIWHTAGVVRALRGAATSNCGGAGSRRRWASSPRSRTGR